MNEFMQFLLYIVVGIFVFLVLDLRSRLYRLEQMVARKDDHVAAASKEDSAEDVVIEEVSHAEVKKSDHDSPDKIVLWLKEDWLLKLGAILLLIGFGWLTTYAFMNDWIGPMGRISFGLSAGVLMMMFAWLRMKRHVHQGGVFLVLGSTVFLLTLFAAREVYDFFNPVLALLLMFSSSAVVALASVKFKNYSLALVGLFFATIAPFLINIPSPNYIGLFFYLLVVTLGMIWVGVLISRRSLILLSLAMFAFYSMPHITSGASSVAGSLLPVVFVFALVFFVVNVVGMLKTHRKVKLVDLLIASGNGLLLLSWILVGAPDVWKSSLILVWMIGFIVAAFLLYLSTKRHESFYVYIGVGIVMLAAATAVELNGEVLVLAYAIQSCVMILLTHALLKNNSITHRMSAVLLGPVLLSIGSVFSFAWKTTVFNQDFFVLLTLGIILTGLGYFFTSILKDGHSKKTRSLGTVLFIGGSVYGLLLIWLSSLAVFQSDARAVVVPLLVYTVVGLVSYFYGSSKGSKVVQMYGGILVAIVVGRLLLVDVWDMVISARIVTFFLIGTLLTSTAFFGKMAKK